MESFCHVVILSSVWASSIRKQGDQGWVETGMGVGVDGRNSGAAAPGQSSLSKVLMDVLARGTREGGEKSRYFS